MSGFILPLLSTVGNRVFPKLQLNDQKKLREQAFYSKIQLISHSDRNKL